MASSQEFPVAVAVYPTGDLEFSHELELVKAAILYAGHVRLYSPTCSLLRGITSKRFSPDGLFPFALEYMESTGQLPPSLDDETLGQLRSVLARARNPHTRRGQAAGRVARMMRPHLAEGASAMQETAARWLSSAAYLELLEAEKAGVLTFVEHDAVTQRPLEYLLDFAIAASRGTPRDGSAERNVAFQEGMAEILLRSVQLAAEYPLLDEQSRALVAAGIASGRVHTSTERSKLAGLGGSIFGQLPIANAPINELLDLRRELESVVGRFRRGLGTASAEIEAAQWEQDFEVAARRIYDGRVAPALEELDDLLRTKPALTRFFDSAGAGATGFGVAGGISVVLDNLLQITPLLLGAVGLGAAAIKVVADRLREREQKHETARKNDWYLLYRARTELEK